MSADDPHPLSQGAAAELPTLGEGCLRRFDPEALSGEHGTEFPGARQAWQRYLAAQAGGLSTDTEVELTTPSAGSGGEE